jgi:hypothetical protein
MTSLLVALRQFIFRHWPYLVMLAVPLVILGPLYARGYILQYDMIFSPFYNINFDNMQNGIGLFQPLVLNLIQMFFSFLLPMDIVQKLILTAVIFLCMFSVYKSMPMTSRVARLLAGIVYTLNPFVYDRLMAGHWRFLLAYSITPFVVKSIYNLLTNPNRKNLLLSALLWSLAVFSNAHHIVIIGVIFGCMVLVFARNLKVVYYALGCVGLVILANIWWLIPAVFIPNSTNSFNVAQFYAFATTSDTNYGLTFNMLSLQGFWHKGWDSIKDYYAFWPLLVIVWLLPVYWGLGRFAALSINAKRLIIALSLASIIALFYAAGPASAISSINVWLYQNVPGLSGMREPQKMLAILAIFYSVLTAYAVDHLLRIKQKRYAVIVIIPFLIASMLIARPMLWGFNGQVKTYEYPTSWYQMRKILDNDKSTHKAILLPWEIYVNNTITNKLVANPASGFFGDKLIVSQRMLLPSVTDVESKQDSDITTALAKKDSRMLIAAMKAVDANYIVITEDFTDGNYSWLKNSLAAHNIINDSKLLVYYIDK